MAGSHQRSVALLTTLHQRSVSPHPILVDAEGCVAMSLNCVCTKILCTCVCASESVCMSYIYMCVCV